MLRNELETAYGRWAREILKNRLSRAQIEAAEELCGAYTDWRKQAGVTIARNDFDYEAAVWKDFEQWRAANPRIAQLAPASEPTGTAPVSAKSLREAEAAFSAACLRGGAQAKEAETALIAAYEGYLTYSPLPMAAARAYFNQRRLPDLRQAASRGTPQTAAKVQNVAAAPPSALNREPVVEAFAEAGTAELDPKAEARTASEARATQRQSTEERHAPLAQVSRVLRITPADSQPSSVFERKAAASLDLLGRIYRRDAATLAPLVAKWDVAYDRHGAAIFTSASGERFADHGERIDARGSGLRAGRISPEAIDALVALAVFKGWETIKISGGAKTSRRALMKRALQRGLAVETINQKDAEMLKQVQAELARPASHLVSRAPSEGNLVKQACANAFKTARHAMALQLQFENAAPRSPAREPEPEPAPVA